MILRGKYCHHRNRQYHSMSFTSKPYDSYIWKSMTKIAPICHQGTARNIGNGRNISLWYDHWISPNFSLRQLIQGPVLSHESIFPLSYIILPSTYNLSTLSFELPTSISLLIHNTNVLPSSTQMDLLHWHLTSNGLFSTDFAYRLFL